MTASIERARQQNDDALLGKTAAATTACGTWSPYIIQDSIAVNLLLLLLLLLC
jgi:hypothetical protein